MNNNAGDQCSSGCESGWTGYLERSWLSPNYSISYHQSGDHDGVRSDQIKIGTHGIEGVEEEEEDMSMVSDASSGPPHFIDDYSSINFNNHHSCTFYPSGGVAETNVAVDQSMSSAALSSMSRGRKKKLNKDVKKQRMMLDDTASSRPVPHHMFKNNEFGLRNKSSSFIENHGMLDISHGFSSTHIDQDGPSAIDLFGHQYQQSQFFGGNCWMGFKQG